MSDPTDDIAELTPVTETTHVSFEEQQELQAHYQEFGPNPGAIIKTVVWDDAETQWDDGATVWIS